MGFIKNALAGIIITTAAQSALGDDGCSKLFFFEDDWRACAKQKLADSGEALIDDAGSALAEMLAQTAIEYISPSLALILFGDDGNAALDAAVQAIIKEIRQSEQNIINAIDELVVKRDYANFDRLAEAVESYMALSSSRKLQQSYKTLAVNLIEDLRVVRYDFQTHPDFDVYTHAKLVSMQLALQALVMTASAVESGTPYDASSDYLEQARITLKNVALFYDKDQAFFSTTFGEALLDQPFSEYYRNIWGAGCDLIDDGRLNKRPAVGKQLVALDDSGLGVITDCDARESLGSGYGYCATSYRFQKGSAGERFVNDYTFLKGAKKYSESDWLDARTYGIRNASDHWRDSDKTVLFSARYNTRCASKVFLDVVDFLHNPTVDSRHAELFFHEGAFNYTLSKEPQFADLIKYSNEWRGIYAPISETLMFRAVALAYRDIDGDGLNYLEERALGANNFYADSDNDGYGDAVESYCRTGIRHKNSPRMKGYFEDCLGEDNFETFQGRGDWTVTKRLLSGQSYAYVAREELKCGGDYYEDYGIKVSSSPQGVEVYDGAYRVGENGRSFGRKMSYVFLRNTSDEARTVTINFDRGCTD
ncbi:hypothetical protein [Agaribacterium haliotis]|uniref:hypothetical protein n=1 Tax=Agaribacterium haliotis TaxID=2013869 RepID=UPI000BB58943|nr:hypothetical protein [Agaribacterium haliotis]